MKYEVSRSKTFWVIALQLSVDRRTDRQTDGRTDRRTDKVITMGLPHLRWRGPNKYLWSHFLIMLWKVIQYYTLFQPQTGNMVWYTLSGFYISPSMGIFNQDNLSGAEIILLIKSDLKWCTHLSRRLFLNFSYLVSVTAGGPNSSRGHT